MDIISKDERLNNIYDKYLKETRYKNQFKTYIKYAQDVLSGEQVAGEYIYLSCKKFFELFDREDIEFRYEEVDKFINFCSKLKHYSGKCAGKYFKLEPWQQWVSAYIFGFYYKESGLRVVNKVLLSMARKQGKSFFMAAIAIYELIIDGGPAAQCLNVASNVAQANLLFDMEKELCYSLDPSKKRFRLMRDTIKYPNKKSYSKVLPSDSNNLDGSSPSCFILDEAHAQKDSKLYDVLRSGQGFVTNPIAIVCSTSGFLLTGFLKVYRDTCIDILKGLKEDDNQASFIYELDEDDEWDDPEVWIKSNPNMNVTVNRKFIEDEIKAAKNNPALEVSVKTKTLNMWVQSQDIWLPDKLIIDSMQDLNKNEDLKSLELPEAYYGIDLSSVSDLTAEARCIEMDGKFYISVKAYIPHDSIDESPNSELYKQWIREGYLIQTSGNVLDVDKVVDDLYAENDNYSIVSVGYDKWQSLTLATKCTDLGINLEEFPQSIGAFSPFTKAFEIGLRNGTIILDYNPVLRWAFQNCTIKEDFNGNQKPVKAGAEQKIDPVIASIMAFGSYLKNCNSTVQSLYLSFNQ